MQVNKISTLNLLKLTNIDISITNLEKFSCDSELINSLFFKGNNSLSEISIPFSKRIESIKISNCISLKSIDINFNLVNKEFILRDTELNKIGITTLDQIKAIKELNKDSDNRGWATLIHSGLFDPK